MMVEYRVKYLQVVYLLNDALAKGWDAVCLRLYDTNGEVHEFKNYEIGNKFVEKK